jgi:hypothetical protein
VAVGIGVRVDTEISEAVDNAEIIGVEAIGVETLLQPDKAAKMVSIPNEREIVLEIMSFIVL